MLTARVVTAAAALSVAAAGVVAAAAPSPDPAAPQTRAVADAAPAHPAAVRRAATTATTPTPGWARASVATVWVKPNRTRPVDHPALLRHPRIARWIDHMSMRQRLDMADRVMTQALRGERLVILRSRSDGWSRVRLPAQTGSAFPTGIIGWVPTRQLSRSAVAPTATAAVGAHPGGRRVVRLARDFLGVRYLWGGMSHHGIDCSGLTYQVYREVGRTLPRDAADQSRHGKPVKRRNLHRGDLVFFGPGGWRTIHHVGIYAGHGRVLHAPHTGSRVQITPLRAWSDYWGARRYL